VQLLFYPPYFAAVSDPQPGLQLLITNLTLYFCPTTLPETKICAQTMSLKHFTSFLFYRLMRCVSCHWSKCRQHSRNDPLLLLLWLLPCTVASLLLVDCASICYFQQC